MIKVLSSLVVGPLDEYAPAVAQELARNGYTPFSAKQHVAFVAHLSRWMDDRHYDPGELTTEILQECFDARREAGYVNYRTMKSAGPLLRVLASREIVITSAVKPSASELLLDRLGDYLARVRGLATGTVTTYTGRLRPLARSRLEAGGAGFKNLNVADDRRFLS